MKYYSQVYGTLNINSEIDGFSRSAINQLDLAKKDYLDKYGSSDWKRIEHMQEILKWTKIVEGGNSSLYIHYATEMANSQLEIKNWLLFLLEYFPSAEGSFFFIEEDRETVPQVWLISAHPKYLEDREIDLLNLKETGKAFGYRVYPLEVHYRWVQGYGNEFSSRTMPSFQSASQQKESK